MYATVLCEEEAVTKVSMNLVLMKFISWLVIVTSKLVNLKRMF